MRLRRTVQERSFPPAWRLLCGQWLWWWTTLEDDERERLEDDILHLLRDRHWQGAAGFELADEMRVLIAAQAALLVLGLDGDLLRRVRWILVQPTGMVLHGERPLGIAGVVTNTPLPVVGHAQRDGTVTLAWDAIERDLRLPGRGENVVIHEFAHVLDFGDGEAAFPDPASRRRWVEVCDDAYARVRHDPGSSVLRRYAATNTAEFFAVVTETFFDRPLVLQAHEPDLYDVFHAYFRQDPAARLAVLGRTDQQLG